MIRSTTSLILASILGVSPSLGQFPQLPRIPNVRIPRIPNARIPQISRPTRGQTQGQQSTERPATPEQQNSANQMISLQQENINIYTDQAKNGSGEAAYQLGMLYRGLYGRKANGALAVTPDYKISADWFLYAALHNNADGAYELGYLHFLGMPEFSVPKDHQKAYSMLRWAADHGSGKAVYFLTRDRDGQNLLAEVGKTYVAPTTQGEEAAKAMLLTILGAALFTVVAGAASGGSSSNGGTTTPYHGRTYDETGMNSAQCQNDQMAVLFGSDNVSRTYGGTPRSCVN